MSNITPRCQECQQWLEEKHDWNGYVWWCHAKPCVPLVSDVLGYCSADGCENPVHGDTPKHANALLFCSQGCREVYGKRRRLKILGYGRKYQRKKRIQQRELLSKVRSANQQ